MKRFFLSGALLLSLLLLFQQEAWSQEKSKFAQMYEEWPTPNVYRNAAGAPGHQYWQQQASYSIAIVLDDAQQRISGEETITYKNNSPDALDYLWLQVDQNMRAKDSDTYKTRTGTLSDRVTLRQIQALEPGFDGGFKIESVKNQANQDLAFTVVKTMMRVDLPQPLKAGEQFVFKVKWWYNINDRLKLGGRSGWEYFEKDDNYLYTIAQFFPRMAVYDEIEGWNHKQFLGSGEFTLPFGNYEVSITVPADHLVAATGVLQNPKDVLNDQQLKRWEEAKKARVDPVIIATQEEAIEREKQKSSKQKTWRFKADNVRDFAFASSRKFIWDAMGVQMKNGQIAMAMSMYPKEGNPLWERYSTKAVAHTLNWYSHYTFDYPYPVAWSIHTDQIGMEYPMICFNGGRPEADGTYAERTKYGLISVVIHEVGHNYFPMIVNSDERQWTWMDEGLNSFLQFLTEQQWERDYPSRRGPAASIASYMNGDKNNIAPIMTNSESVFQLGNNAYGKPAAALNILRETVLGRELFDFAFKQYANRWKFKHPSPADFFRSMEDASGIDLDWFWRGWFYTTDKVDIAISDVKYFRADTKNPEIENALARKEQQEAPKSISSIRNRESIAQTYDEQDPKLKDFYATYDPLDITPDAQESYKRYVNSLTEEERNFLASGKHFYELTFQNLGGLVMPLIIEFTYEDGSKEVQRIPAEIWRYHSDKVSKVFVTDKEVAGIVLDPYLETADTDIENNYFPPRPEKSRFELFKGRSFNNAENPMQRAGRSGSGRSNGSNE